MSAAPLDQSSVRTGLYAELPIPREATTSRVVVNNELLRVVLFAMDEGQELTEHASPRAVTIQALEGTMTVGVGGTPHLVSAGDVIYLAPGERHTVLAQSPVRFALVMVDLATRAAG